MKEKAPPWLATVNDDPKRAVYAAMTPEERLRCFAEVCELGRVLLEARPDRERVLRESEPMPDHAARVWQRLVRQARRERPSW